MNTTQDNDITTQSFAEFLESSIVKINVLHLFRTICQ